MQHLFAAPSSTSLSWLLKSIVIGKVCTLRSEGSCCSAGFGISSSKNRSCCLRQCSPPLP
ncbi:unnamed protein product [Linum tenue]|uniref:Uncharacterized protein n=1 Tax=Linum tenue TaxID=586396 RepID=A0AAV0L857_9ROSI|nr:unnamed protein product [Linum tenue]